MKATIKSTGFEEVIFRLGNEGEKVSEKARKTMRRSADRILKNAKLNTPRDTGALENSIRMELSYGYRGRLQILVMAGGIVNGVNVDSYAMMIHENYESVHPYPGKNTILKMQENPGRLIGSHFLTRAADDEKDKLEAAMVGITRLDIKL